MKTTITLGVLSLFLAGCASTTSSERAFQKCRWEEGPERDRCVERQLADYRWDEHQAAIAREVATRKAEHRESVCLGQGGDENACERYGDFGPDTAAPEPIEVDLTPLNPDTEY